MVSKLSVIILTHNSERTLSDCIESVSWCDEIIVLDDNSSDKTLEIAKEHKTKIYRRSVKEDFAKQRNYGLTLVKNEWVLFVDADEQVSEALSHELQETLKDARCNGYLVPRRDIRWGKKLRFGEYFHFSLLRLGKIGKGPWVGKVHERWGIVEPIGALKAPILHFPQNGINDFLEKINIYSTIRARELQKKGVHVDSIGIISYPLGKFVFNYIIRLGFLDGIPGIISAIGMSFYTFMVRAKLWFLWNESTKKTN